MKTPNRSQFFLSAAVAALALVAGAASAQERVAQLSKVDGGVTITKAETRESREAKQLGPRVKNGSVFAGEVVATDGTGTATLWFSDGSEINLKPGTKLMIQELNFTALVASGQKDKQAGRKIKILAGNIFSHIVPNPQIATEFETPSGVAAVKGTELELSVDSDGSGDVKTTEGTVWFTTDSSGVVVKLHKGFGARFARSRSGIDILARGDNPGALSLLLPNGMGFEAAAGASLRAKVEGFSVAVSAEKGNVTLAGKPVETGKPVTYGHATFASTTNVACTVKTESGTVDFISAQHGVTMVLKEGNAGTFVEKPSGRIVLSAPATNASPVEVKVNGQKTVLAPGKDASVSVTGGGQTNLGANEPPAEKKTEEGKSTPEQKSSTSTESTGTTTPPTQANCGDCGVPDGTGGCTYVDSLCPDEDCLKGRKCNHGQCVGGRKVASKENPVCHD